MKRAHASRHTSDEKVQDMVFTAVHSGDNWQFHANGIMLVGWPNCSCMQSAHPLSGSKQQAVDFEVMDDLHALIFQIIEFASQACWSWKI